MKIQPTPPAAWTRTARTGARQRGFTLIELIMVMVMLGVLAVFAAPRIFSSSDVYARGFHDETMAYLRYAQKAAIAQRRTVCVAFGANTLTLTMALNAPSAAATVYDCSTPAASFTGPKGESTVVLPARPGVNYSAAPAPINFNFNGLGQPISSAGAAMATQTFQVAGVTPSIIVEAVTGYIHE